MENCCRICLDRDKTLLSLQTVVEIAGEKFTCMEMYYSITKIEEPPVELLHISQNVCVSCFAELNSSYKFQQKAIESFQVLVQNVPEELVQSVENEELDIDEEKPDKMALFEEVLEKSSDIDDQAYCDVDFLEEQSSHDIPSGKFESDQIEHDICGNANTVEREFRCIICSELLNSQVDLNTHSILEHCQRTSNGELICSVCNKLFGTRKSLRQHSRIHQKEDLRKFRCRFCEKAFNYPHHLRIHETTHTKVKPFSCSTCGKSFASKDRLTNHERQHADDFQFNCESCSASFRSRKALTMHCILKHDAAVDKFDPIECDKCGKKLYSQSATSAHLKGPCGNDVCASMDSKMTDERDRKEYTCDQCSRTFKSRSSYSVHLKLHDAIENKCKSCPKVFSNSYDLQCHESQDHQSRTHTCEICGMSFLQVVVLKRHLKTHSGERTFMCTFCPERFTQMATLKNHEITHSEQSQFTCSRCPKKYKFLASLKNHEKMHHSEQEM